MYGFFFIGGGFFFHIQFDFCGLYSACFSKYSFSAIAADMSLHKSIYFSSGAGLFSKLQGSVSQSICLSLPLSVCPSVCLFTSEFFILPTAGMNGCGTTNRQFQSRPGASISCVILRGFSANWLPVMLPDEL